MTLSCFDLILLTEVYILFIFLGELPYFCQMIRVVLLGSGNVAQHLYTAFLNQKLVEVVQCYNRKGIRLHHDQKQNTITKELQSLKKADVYILAVSDDAIGLISEKLPFKNQLVIHTSGSVPIDVITNSNRKGVFYPLQTFSKDKEVDFTSVPFCLEAKEKKDLILLKDLASLLSDKVYEISSQQRNILHVAAVFVNNFTNYLFSTGHRICEEHNIPFEILHPLMLETVKKATEMHPDNAQTGPAVRNDTKTIERHLKILSNSSQKNLYQTLTQAILLKHGKKL